MSSSSSSSSSSSATAAPPPPLASGTSSIAEALPPSSSAPPAPAPSPSASLSYLQAHYTRLGYKVFSGLQFGVHLVLYSASPDRVHSDYAVYVLGDDEAGVGDDGGGTGGCAKLEEEVERKEQEREGEGVETATGAARCHVGGEGPARHERRVAHESKLDFRTMQSLCRQMPILHKKLILARVVWGLPALSDSSSTSSTYGPLVPIGVEEMLVDTGHREFKAKKVLGNAKKQKKNPDAKAKEKIEKTEEGKNGDKDTTETDAGKEDDLTGDKRKR